MLIFINSLWWLRLTSQGGGGDVAGCHFQLTICNALIFSLHEMALKSFFLLRDPKEAT